MAIDSFEFLGGRYNRPEQIMSGPMQAFRAQNAATGRTVFIHRVSTKEAPEEQAALLKLLTTALVKSADAKRLVLDFGEERGYWYVVTESEPQCALLREWLQLEIDAAAASSRLGIAPNSTNAPVARQPSPSTSATPKPAEDPGEFTRFLQTKTNLNSPATPQPKYVPHAAQPAEQPPSPPVPPSPPKEQVVGEFTRVFQSASAQAPPPAPPAPAAPVSERPVGEFTRFFRQGDVAPEQQPPFTGGTPQRPPVSETRPAPPPLPMAEPPEAGEFTRFFKGGLPPSPPKPSTPPVPLPERPANNPFVQRPNTPLAPSPITPSAAKRPEVGEFTQMFARPANAPPPQRPTTANNPPTFALPTEQVRPTTEDRSADLFSDKIDIPKPLPSSQPAQGEFTRMFGSHGSAATPVQPPAGVAPPPPKSLVDDVLPHAQPPSSSAIGNQADAGPSEFTRIMQGGYGTAKPAAEKPKEDSPVALPNLSSLSSLPKPPAMPKLAVPKPPAAPALLATAAAGKNKKMAIFFSILGVLVLLLISLTLFLIKK